MTASTRAGIPEEGHTPLSRFRRDSNRWKCVYDRKRDAKREKETMMDVARRNINRLICRAFLPAIINNFKFHGGRMKIRKVCLPRF